MTSGVKQTEVLTSASSTALATLLNPVEETSKKKNAETRILFRESFHTKLNFPEPPYAFSSEGSPNAFEIHHRIAGY